MMSASVPPDYIPQNPCKDFHKQPVIFWTHLPPKLSRYKSQSIEFQSKSVHQFLYDVNIVHKWIKVDISRSFFAINFIYLVQNFVQ